MYIPGDSVAPTPLLSGTFGIYPISAQPIYLPGGIIGRSHISSLGSIDSNPEYVVLNDSTL